MGKRKIKTKDPLEIHSALRKLKNQRASFFTWKRHSSDGIIYISKIQKIEFDSVSFKPTNKEGYDFTQKDEVVFFCRDVNLAIIAKPKVYDDLKVKITFPKDLVVLEQDELDKLGVLFFDKKGADFSEKRDEERKGPGEEKLVSVKKAIVSLHNPTTMHTYPLKDLSPNGASFLVEDPGEYTTGTEVELHSIDGDDLNEILVGEVKSVIEMKDHRFKVGLQLVFKKKRRGAA